MVATNPVVHSHPGIMSGIPVFVGTRVPVDTLFDYLVGGQDLAEFLDDFSSVSHEQAVEALELLRAAVLDVARARPAR